MNSIGNLEVIQPHEIFLGDRGMNGLTLSFSRTILSKESFGQSGSKLPVSGIVQKSAVSRESLARGIPLLTWSEDIHKRDSIGFRYCLHGLGVDLQVGILFLPIWNTEFCREILNSIRRDESQLRN